MHSLCYYCTEQNGERMERIKSDYYLYNTMWIIITDHVYDHVAELWYYLLLWVIFFSLFHLSLMYVINYIVIYEFPREFAMQ